MTLFEVYKTWDIEPVRGLGTTLWDSEGNSYTDLYGGHAVISIGHSHPHYIKMLTEQLGRLGFYSNAVQNSLQKDLASRLGRASGYDDYRLFLCNSGAEANENAMKLASFATGKARILAFRRSFHGRTAGAVAATDNPAIRAPFNSAANVGFVELGDTEAVERELAGGEYAGVIIEGIQGVAGIYEPSDDFLRELRRLCDRYGAALILDEIQSGYGRSGLFFAHQRTGKVQQCPEWVVVAGWFDVTGRHPMARKVQHNIAASKGMATGKVHICIHTYSMYLPIGNQSVHRVVRRRFGAKHAKTTQANRAVMTQPPAAWAALSPHRTPVGGQRASGVPPVHPHAVARFKATKHLGHIALVRLQHSQFVSRGQRIDHSTNPLLQSPGGSLTSARGPPVHTLFVNFRRLQAYWPRAAFQRSMAAVLISSSSCRPILSREAR